MAKSFTSALVAAAFTAGLVFYLAHSRHPSLENAGAPMRSMARTSRLVSMARLPQRITVTRAVAQPDITSQYTEPNQKLRHSTHISEGNQRALDIDSVYSGKSFEGKNIVVTGANRGLGLQLATELVSKGANVIGTTRKGGIDLDGINQVIDGIDVADDAAMGKLVKDLNGKKIDILINNAGYFLKDPETIDNLNFPEEMKMIDICAVGPLRTTAALVNAGLMDAGSKVITITSQGGSIAWRDVQNEGGPYDYGHHMSKGGTACVSMRVHNIRLGLDIESYNCFAHWNSSAAANMMCKLLSMELKEKGISVLAVHPGFNKTKMTEKYKDIWEEEGAVDPRVGAKRVCHEIELLDLVNTGKFVNAEDGLEIPW
eukprot:1392665-Amorphochlora_amoeboformis.AAC.1